MEYETDFAAYFDKTTGRYWTLIELERADVPLFTKKGDPSRHLIHGLRQIHDWQRWVSDNRAYAQKYLTDIEDPIGVLVIGRREQVTEEEAKRLRQMLRDTPKMEIMTYDRLLNMAWAGLSGWEYVEVQSHAQLLRTPPPACDFNRDREWERAAGSRISSASHITVFVDQDGKTYSVDPTREWDEDGIFEELPDDFLEESDEAD